MGVYSNAIEANKFYEEIYYDIEKAVNKGELVKKEGVVVSNLAGIFKIEDLGKMLKYSLMGYKEIVTYQDLKTSEQILSGTEEDILKMSIMISTEVGFSEGDSNQGEIGNKLTNMLIKIYQSTSWLFILIVVFVYLTEIVIYIYKHIKKEECNLSLWMIKTGFILIILAYTVSMSLIYYEVMPNVFREYYAASMYPVWQVLVCLTLGQLYLYRRKRKAED